MNLVEWKRSHKGTMLGRAMTALARLLHNCSNWKRAKKRKGRHPKSEPLVATLLWGAFIRVSRVKVERKRREYRDQSSKKNQLVARETASDHATPSIHPGMRLEDFPLAAPMNDITLGVDVTVLSTSVLLPMTTSVAAGASEMGVPDTVITPPGVRVWLSITKAPDASAVYVWPANVITAAVVGDPGAGA